MTPDNTTPSREQVLKKISGIRTYECITLTGDECAALTTSPTPPDHGESVTVPITMLEEVWATYGIDINAPPNILRMANSIARYRMLEARRRDDGDSTLQRISAAPEPQADRPAADVTDAWRKPPPHFKPDPRWQRQPQSDKEWDAHEDEPGKREFRAKRRLAFAGDLADPRAPKCMALVSRLDLSVVLSRLTWLEARFENTRDIALPPVAEPIASVPVTQESLSAAIAVELDRQFPEWRHYISEGDLADELLSLIASHSPPAAPRAAGMGEIDGQHISSFFSWVR